MDGNVYKGISELCPCSLRFKVLLCFMVQQPCRGGL